MIHKTLLEPKRGNSCGVAVRLIYKIYILKKTNYQITSLTITSVDDQSLKELSLTHQRGAMCTRVKIKRGFIGVKYPITPSFPSTHFSYFSQNP